MRAAARAQAGRCAIAELLWVPEVLGSCHQSPGYQWAMKHVGVNWRKGTTSKKTRLGGWAPGHHAWLAGGLDPCPGSDILSSERSVQPCRLVLVSLSPHTHIHTLTRTHTHLDLDQHPLCAQGIHFLGGTGNLCDSKPHHPSFLKGFLTKSLLRGAAGWAGSSYENKTYKVRGKRSQTQ